MMPIKPFKSIDYFEQPAKGEISLSEKGIELIATYYNEKYSCSIEIPRNSFGNAVPISTLNESLPALIQECRKEKSLNYRKAFIIGAASGHAIPLIYLRENGEELFLLADSQGESARIKHYLPDIKNNSDISIMIVAEVRQRDFISCYTDALIFARDTTRVKNNSYFIPNLFQDIKNRKNYTYEGPHNYVLLPDELLKTTQRSAFRVQHTQYSKKEINGKLTLNQFVQKHTDNTDGKYKYLENKSIALAKLIEILFYFEQMNSTTKFNAVDKENFIHIAKQIMAEGKPLFPYLEALGNYVSYLKKDKAMHTDTLSFSDYTRFRSAYNEFYQNLNQLLSTLALKSDSLKNTKPNKVTIIGNLVRSFKEVEQHLEVALNQENYNLESFKTLYESQYKLLSDGIDELSLDVSEKGRALELRREFSDRIKLFANKKFGIDYTLSTIQNLLIYKTKCEEMASQLPQLSITKTIGKN
ncbi:hypothetical protein ACNVED_16240 (plasmid) [Legionella sp. D16C41]|uniref:hypothetical protein n=1 Tax=Legionella sp. D16C41 TaxID=3402688 RepID=UPI003AF75521